MIINSQSCAIVTGGASGLGLASATALAKAGVKVAIFDLNAERGEPIAADLGGIFCRADVTDEDSVAAAFAKARGAHGQENILVHCAAAAKPGKTVSIDKTSGGFKRLSTDDFAFTVNATLVGSYRVASHAALGMATLEANDDGERGVIILTASVAATDAQVGQVGYGSAKAGVNGLVLPMARDLMDLGIRVNAIMPGLFGTPPLLALPEKVLEVLSASVPFPKRLGKPEEFASLVLELVRNAYFNGQSIRLDGAIRMPPR